MFTQFKMLKLHFKKTNHAIFLLCLVIVLFFSVYKLTESPPVWMDEGVISQVAENMAIFHKHALQIAPHVFDSAWYATTAFTVTLPVSIAFSFFGVGVLQARFVMVLFILALYIGTYFLIRKKSDLTLLLTLLLLVTFAPLYGQGKNVLGEVPGLAFLVAGLVLLNKVVDGNPLNKKRNLCMAGILFGLTIATKPIFILLIPALVVSLFLYRKKFFSSMYDIGTIGCGLIIPLILWAIVQFNDAALATVLKLYSNPNHLDVGYYVVLNLKRFVTEAQPLYALILFVLWTVGGVIRYKRKINILATETIAWMFSFLMLLAYVRTAGFYRYFFIGEVLSLIYVLPSILSLQIKEKKGIFFYTILSFFTLVVIFQLYQTSFHSWVADHYESTRSKVLEEHVGTIDPQKSVFFYQVPETVLFFHGSNYYQYFAITDSLLVGDGEIKLLSEHVPDLIVTSQTLPKDAATLFAHYHVIDTFDRYEILSK